MNKRRWLAAALALCLSLVGCGRGTAVYVQSVDALMGMGGIAPGDRFAGVVVSENVTEIKRDPEKSVKELLVKAGDDVQEGQELFSYDTDELQLTLDKQELELEQLYATIDNYEAQIRTLERDRNNANANSRLEYTIEIQSAQLDMKEAELKVKTKEAEVEASRDLLEHAAVESPVSGRVQAVSENGTDNMGNPLPYITIQQAGSYRVKGTLGELQRGGIQAGNRMKLISRTDPDTFWTGTVTVVDYESPYQGSENDRYYGMSSDEMTSSSRYPFYVELDSTEGLILGQHIYMELLTEEASAGLSIGNAFVCYEEDGTAYVWAENKGRLEKRTVTLGDYDPMKDTVAVLEGLTAEDYIAFPDPELCREGAATTRDQAVQETEGEVA